MEIIGTGIVPALTGVDLLVLGVVIDLAVSLLRRLAGVILLVLGVLIGLAF